MFETKTHKNLSNALLSGVKSWNWDTSISRAIIFFNSLNSNSGSTTQGPKFCVKPTMQWRLAMLSQ